VIQALYQPGLTRPTQAVLGNLVLTVNLVAYGVLLRRNDSRDVEGRRIPRLCILASHSTFTSASIGGPMGAARDDRPGTLRRVFRRQIRQIHARGDSLTERQRDSILAQSRIPGASGVGRRCGRRFHERRVSSTDSVSP